MPISIPLPISKGGTGEAAQGPSAFSAGNLNVASGQSSLAVGYLNEASGGNSLAIGYSNSAEDITGAAIGYSNSASASNASAIGSDNTSSGVNSNAFGSLNFSYGTNSSSFGYGTTAGGLNSSAFGYLTKTYTDNTAELGVWTSLTQRGGSIRTDSSGLTSFTFPSRETPFPSGGSIKGAEPIGSLPMGSMAFRSFGGLSIDYNVNGPVTTLPLFPVIGQSSKNISSPPQTISFSGTGVYADTGITAVFDASVARGTIAGSGGFSIKSISPYTRFFSVSAAIEIERTLSGTNDIGIKLAKNGVPIDETEIQENTSQGNPAYLTTTWVIELENLDEVSLVIANMTSTNSVQFNRGRIVATTID